MLDFDPNQIEKDFAKNTVFQMEFTLIEFEFDMKAFFYTDFHLDRSICIWFNANIWHDKFLFFRYAIVISVYHYVYEVAQPNDNTVVSLELFFDPVELEIIRNIVCKCTWWFQVSDYL